MSYLQSYVNRRIILIAFACLLIGIVTVPQAAFALNKSDQSEMKQSKSGRVLLVSVPRVTWKSIEDISTPNIDRLATIGSVANLSIRTPSKNRSIEKGYATISAGHRASAMISNSSTFYSPNEELDGYSASSIYRQEQGKTITNAAGLALGFELSRDKSNEDLSPATIGSFGNAIWGAGKTIAAFGNADLCAENTSQCRDRSIGYIGTNSDGVLKRGNISRSLLNDKNMLDMKKLETLSVESLKTNDVTAVECSDLDRVERLSRESTEQIAQRDFKNAVVACDQLIGTLTSNLDLKKDMVMVFSPMSSVSTEELTLFVAAGADIDRGYAISGITRRSGIVALADIAPTILDFLDIKRPSDMVDTLIGWQADSSSLKSREQALIDTNQTALLRDNSFNAVAGSFIVIVFFSVILAVLAFKKSKKLLPYAKALSLVSIMMPTTSFLILPIMNRLNSQKAVLVLFLVLSALFGLLAGLTARRFGYVKIVLVVSAVSLAVQLGDILTGGVLQLNSLFGYSAIVAGRFAGFGNLSFSIVSINAVLVVALIKQLSLKSTKVKPRNINIALVALLVFVLIIVGAPYFGSDVGGVLALTPTAFITSLMLFEKRINLRAFLYAGISTFAAISVFSLFDLNRPASERTHLGRFVEVLVNGDAGVVIEGKIVSNLNILTNSVLASVIIITTVFFMFIFLRPEKFIAQTANTYPVFSYIAFPGLVVGVLGMFLNDSGVAIPGMMIAIAFPSVALVATDLQINHESDPTSGRPTL